MFRLATAIAALSLSLAPSFALAQEGGQFAEATETVPNSSTSTKRQIPNAASTRART